MTCSNTNHPNQSTQNTQAQSSQNTSPRTRIIRPWLFEVAPYPDESFSHFLGRFRRANCLSGSHLASMLGERSHVVTYWESPSRQRRPNRLQLQQLSQMSGVALARLQQMWSSADTRLHWPTRLCPDCYAHKPWHRLTWQQAEHPQCDQHPLLLLSCCPRCQHPLCLPSQWAIGECDRCQLPFSQMAPIEVHDNAIE
ncbi:MAG TPA: TniQ family protein [Candidatus Obscuribacterales bacterium]